MTVENPLKPQAQFYGRRLARPLRPARAQALTDVLSKIRLNLEALGAQPDGTSLRTQFFDKPVADVWLEIGFGNGDSLAAWHVAQPQIGFLGCEPFINGVSALCKAIATHDLGNIRIIENIAQPVLAVLPPESLGRIYLLNSDPWPKKRHHRRRVIQTDTLDAMVQALVPGGLLIMTTDHDDLATWMLAHALRHPDLVWTAARDGDWLKPPADWMPTRYEGKGAEAGRQQKYLIFKKNLRIA